MAFGPTWLFVEKTAARVPQARRPCCPLTGPVRLPAPLLEPRWECATGKSELCALDAESAVNPHFGGCSLEVGPVLAGPRPQEPVAILIILVSLTRSGN